MFCQLFSSDGLFVASGCIDGTVKIWNFLKRTEEFTVEVHDDAVVSIFFTPDFRYLLTDSCDKTVKILDIKKKKRKSLY